MLSKLFDKYHKKKKKNFELKENFAFEFIQLSGVLRQLFFQFLHGINTMIAIVGEELSHGSSKILAASENLQPLLGDRME